MLGHHSGCDHKDASAGEFHLLGLVFLKDDQLQCFQESHISVMSMGTMGLQIVDFGKHTAQAANVDRLTGYGAGAHHESEMG